LLTLPLDRDKIPWMAIKIAWIAIKNWGRSQIPAMPAGRPVGGAGNRGDSGLTRGVAVSRSGTFLSRSRGLFIAIQGTNPGSARPRAPDSRDLGHATPNVEFLSL
jgi:hypothetical protein